MKRQKDFIIPFGGLSAGEHEFRFNIDNEFFESFEYFDSERGKLNVDVTLNREPSLLDFRFFISGNVDLVCDRCLNCFNQPVSGEFRLIVKFGKDFHEESDEVVVIPNTESNFDLRQYIFEYINFLIPVKRVHLNIEDCDQEMIGKLENISKPATDSRWDILKKLKTD